MMDDDEDSFLYGDAPVPASTPVPAPQKQPENAVEVISVPPEAAERHANGIVAHLEAKAAADDDDEDPFAVELITTQADESEQQQKEERQESEQLGNGEIGESQAEEETEEQGDEEEEAEEESDEDIEFILEPPTRSLDFRSQRGGHRPVQGRTPSAPAGSTSPVTNLTTEYTPRERGAPAETLKQQPPIPGQAETPQLPPETPAINVIGTSVQPTAAQQPPADEGPDPSTLPPVRAPPSHPHIDPSVPGSYEGRSIFEIDMTNLAEKPWRRPGADISDWFNYGFDEISWEAYCYRRRGMGDMAGVLKTNVLNFAGMQEEQFLGLPPEARTMVMTGTNALMGAGAGGGAVGPNGPPPGVGVGVGPGMIPPVGMNPMGPMNPMMAAEMAGIPGMGPMGVGMGQHPMGMGMNGDMNIGQGAPGPMMQDGQVMGQGPNALPGPTGTPEQVGAQMSLPDGIPGGPPPGMMGMGMNMGGGGPDFGPMQMQETNMPNQALHAGGMDQHQHQHQHQHQLQHQHQHQPTSVGPAPGPQPSVPPRTGSTPASFRGRGAGSGTVGGGVGVSIPSATTANLGANIPSAPRGRGGGAVGGAVPPTFPGRGRVATSLPVRPASPLPPNVPTGPRNPGNRYKDRDNNAPAVEGLDYGGNKDGSGGAAGGGTPSERERERDRERERERDRGERERERERDRGERDRGERDRERGERERDRLRDREREKELDRLRDVDEKSSARKRRSPPSNEEDRIGRSSKRR